MGLYFKAKQRIAAGEDLISLTIGQPEVAPPAELAAGVRATAAGHVGYTNGSGLLDYRQVLANRYERRTSRGISPDQILVTAGYKMPSI